MVLWTKTNGEMRMLNVTLPPPPTRGWYARYVLRNGHVPGVLSGAEIKGKASQYSGWYWRARQRVIEHAAEHGVYAKLVLDPERHRWVRVWVNEEGQPVRVYVTRQAN